MSLWIKQARYIVFHIPARQLPGARPTNDILIEFDQNFQYSGLKCAQPITMEFYTRHDSKTLVTMNKSI